MEHFDNFRQQKKEDYLDIIVADLRQEIARLGPNIISIYTAPRITDVRSFLWGGYSMRMQYNYITDLREPLETSYGATLRVTSGRGSTRWRNGPANWRLRSRTTPKLCSASCGKNWPREGHTFWHSQEPEYLKEIMAAYPDNVRMYQLLEDGELVSLQVTVEYKDRVNAWMGGTSLKESHYTEYLIWEIMKMAKANGFTIYENPGGDTKRLCTFKAKFNPTLECCHYLYKKDVFGEMAGRAYYTALKVPLLRGLIK